MSKNTYKELMFKAMFLASEEFCEEDCIASSWKEELEDYMEENR